MLKKVTKAVFPVAGLGTRFLPATKAAPKEMLPIVDKPLIQYAVEEAVASGITQLVFVTSSSKRSIEDHFDSNYELESKLEERNKLELLSIVRDILPQGVSCAYVRQPNPLGLGHAVLCAQPIVGDEPFAVLLADDLIDCEDHYCLERMVDMYSSTASSVIAAQRVSPNDTQKYGIMALDERDPSTGCLRDIVEKPHPKNAPSNLAAVGRYILTPKIFDHLAQIGRGAGGEIQLTDAISRLLKEEDVFAYQFHGVRYDCGSKIGYLQAVVNYALRHPEVGEEFRAYLSRLSIQELCEV